MVALESPSVGQEASRLQATSRWAEGAGSRLAGDMPEGQPEPRERAGVGVVVRRAGGEVAVSSSLRVELEFKAGPVSMDWASTRDGRREDRGAEAGLVDS